MSFTDRNVAEERFCRVGLDRKNSLISWWNRLRQVIRRRAGWRMWRPDLLQALAGVDAGVISRQLHY
jgi:hypothetical protein